MNKENKEIRKRISVILREFGIPCHLVGYKYLQDALFIGLTNPSELSNLTKGLYVDLAKKYDTKPYCVERTIKTAISTGWKNTEATVIRNVFRNTADSETPPTNSCYIATLLEEIKLDIL